MADGGLTLALAIGALATTAAATGVSVSQNMAAADREAEAQKAMASQAENNAAIARQQAEVNAQRIRQQNRRIAASNRAATSANGLLATGSAEAVAYDSAIQGELNALSEVYAGNIAATNSQFEASMYRRKAASASAQKSGYMIGGALSATGSALSIGSNYRRDKALLGSTSNKGKGFTG